jgi:Domain of unknown function (DUF4413)
VCKVLEVFLDASNLFSGTSYPTVNLFLVEIFRVKKEISNAYASDDIFLKSMSVPTYEKFEKYWGVCDPFSRAPHRLWAMGCERRTRRSLPSVHLFSAG